MREAPDYGCDGFLYMPFAEAAASHDITRHHLLALFYAPANQIDRLLFDGEAPVDCIMWELSG